ncbi:MAG: ABC transporter permease, partial [Thermoplasmata archaeon]|nr:ABC transporter permease [Thermoplasmata archaeon]
MRSIFDNTGLGRLDLEAKRTPSSSVFMNMDDAQDLLDVGQKVNAAVFQYKNREIVGTEEEAKFLSRSEDLLDITVGAESIELVIQPSPRGWSVLTSDRIFLQGHLEPALGATTFSWSPTLTYFVDRLVGPNGADLSYSTVSGLDFAQDRRAFEDWRWNGSSPRTEPQADSLQALVNNWTANQLDIEPGDTVTVDYTTVNDRYQLETGSVDLMVVGVVDLAGKAYDPSLLPPIPGVHDAVSCLDWEAPFPMDLQTIEDEDVAYWNAYKGTPKVWIDLDTAKDLWSNPDGNWTSARYYPHGDTSNVSLDHFDDAVTASDAGISINAARADALATSDPLAIFEQMFLAFGAVLLLAGCLLEASAFANLARSRLREHATLRALGLDEKGMVQVMLMEGMVWAAIAGILGITLGAGLGASLVAALNSVWADAVQGATIPLRIDGGSLWLALGVGLLVTLATLFLSSRKASRAHIATALADRTGTGVDTSEPIPRKRAWALAIVLLTVPAVVGAIIGPTSNMGGIATFFIVGALASMGGVLIAIPILERLETRVKRGGLLAPWRMGLRSINRRPGRALTLIATFALVAFAVIGISWAGEIEIRYAGDLQEEMTGGYDVQAETWVQVGGDLKDDPDAPPGDWTVTPVKVVGHEGGTCSNLNARFPPRIMGMPPEFLEDVDLGFRSSTVGDDRETWLSLEEQTGKGRIPVAVDYNTLVWVYGGS